MTLKETIYSIIQPLIGETTIWLDQNKPRPALPYVGIKVSPFRAVNGDHYGAPNSSGVMSIAGDREFTLNIQRYGDDSITKLIALTNAMRKWSVIASFNTAKIAIVDTAMPATDISYSLDGLKFEIRAAVDFRFRTKSYIADDVGLIETVTTVWNP